MSYFKKKIEASEEHLEETSHINRFDITGQPGITVNVFTAGKRTHHLIISMVDAEPTDTYGANWQMNEAANFFTKTEVEELIKVLQEALENMQ